MHQRRIFYFPAISFVEKEVEMRKEDKFSTLLELQLHIFNKFLHVQGKIFVWYLIMR